MDISLMCSFSSVTQLESYLGWDFQPVSEFIMKLWLHGYVYSQIPSNLHAIYKELSGVLCHRHWNQFLVWYIIWPWYICKGIEIWPNKYVQMYEFHSSYCLLSTISCFYSCPINFLHWLVFLIPQCLFLLNHFCGLCSLYQSSKCQWTLGLSLLYLCSHPHPLEICLLYYECISCFIPPPEF